jgi:hypothetical protein
MPRLWRWDFRVVRIFRGLTRRLRIETKKRVIADALLIVGRAALLRRPNLADRQVSPTTF